MYSMVSSFVTLEIDFFGWLYGTWCKVGNVTSGLHEVEWYIDLGLEFSANLCHLDCDVIVMF